jgi:hypothetical protein
VASLREKYFKEHKERKRLLNRVIELQGAPERGTRDGGEGAER